MLPDSLNTLLKHGYESIFVLLFLEAIGLPVPGAVVLLAGGAAAATGALNPGVTFMVAVGAMVLGDLLWFLLGRYTGWALLGFLCRLSLSPETCILRSAESFYKRGRAALLVAKFIPGINTMAPPLAGSMNMAPIVFLVLDLGGAILYVLAYGLPGYLFSEFLKNIVQGVQAFGTAMEWVILTALALYIAYRVFLFLKQPRFGAAPKTEVSIVASLTNSPNPPGMIIADVRSHGYYDRGAKRIKGSIRLEPNALAAILPTLPKDKKIYIYCTCLREATSIRVAQAMREYGLEAYVIVGGLKAWQRAGLPIESVPIEDLIQLPTFKSA